MSKKKPMHPNSLANLTPVQKGQILNPDGKKGKTGDKGLSLKASYKKYINSLPASDHDKIWAGLFHKCRTGDVAAIRLLVELNDEQVNEKVVDSGLGLGVVIIPNKTDEG